MNIPRRSCSTLLGSAVSVFLCASAAAQEGYYGVGHDKWHQGFANSDAGWDAYAHTAIDQAERAVRELLG